MICYYFVYYVLHYFTHCLLLQLLLIINCKNTVWAAPCVLLCAVNVMLFSVTLAAGQKNVSFI